MVQNNEWGAHDGQCITATAQGFTVDSGNHHKDDSPAAYPSIMSGCWMGTCTTGTTLPQRISGLGPITSSIAGRIPDGTRSNLAYDIWADPTPRRDGHNSGMELMIWLKENGGIDPIGQQIGTVSIGGAIWQVWKGTNGGVNVISYVRQGYVEAADNLPITDFVRDAVREGSAQDDWYLTNIQAGFEPWQGGPGLALTRFSVNYGGSTPGAVPSPSSTTSAPRTPPTTSGSDDSSDTGSTPSGTDGGTTATPGSTSSPATPSSSGAAAGTATGAQWALTRGLAGFQSTPWNNQGAQDPAAAPSPNVAGRQVVRFTVPGGGKRSEVQPENDTFSSGTKYFGYSAFLDRNFAVNASSWQVIFQLHDGGTNGSPPVALEIGDGHLWFSNVENGHDKDLGPVQAGTNISVQMQVSFEGAGRGRISIWRDGRPVVTNYAPAQGTMVDGSDYLKTGIYRDPSIGQDSTLFLNDLKIGDSLASVSGLAGAPAAATAPAGAAVGGAALIALGSPLALAAVAHRRRRARHLRRNDPR